MKYTGKNTWEVPVQIAVNPDTGKPVLVMPHTSEIVSLGREEDSVPEYWTQEIYKPEEWESKVDNSNSGKESKD